MKQGLCFLLFAFNFGTSAQQPGEAAGAIFPGLSAYSAQFADVFSVRANAAALPTLRQFSAGLYSERRFLLAELSTHSLAICLPAGPGSFGIRADYSGSSAFHQTAIHVAYGRGLTKDFSLGLSFQYQTKGIAGYGHTSAIGYGLSATTGLANGVRAGFSLENPVQLSIAKDGEELLTIYSAGLGWDFSPAAFAGLRLQKTEDQPLMAQVALHYAFADRFYARVSLATLPAVYSVGVGLRLQTLRIEFNTSFHPQLGATPAMAVLYAKPE